MKSFRPNLSTTQIIALGFLGAIGEVVVEAERLTAIKYPSCQYI